jgi:hypothetical protein
VFGLLEEHVGVLQSAFASSQLQQKKLAHPSDEDFHALETMLSITRSSGMDKL